MTATAQVAKKEAIVADDHPLFRYALCGLLTEHFAITGIHQASSFDQALDILSHRPGIGLALFDLAMPGLDSAEALTTVRKCHPDVITAVVSASTRRDDVFQALQAGVHGFVPKVLSIDALIQALRMIVDGLIYVPSFITSVEGVSLHPPCEPAAWRGLARTHSCSLTPRQRQVLDLIVAGQSNKEIARSLIVCEGTVKIHVAALLRLLRVPNRSAAASVGADRARLRELTEVPTRLPPARHDAVLASRPAQLPPQLA